MIDIVVIILFVIVGYCCIGIWSVIFTYDEFESVDQMAYHILLWPYYLALLHLKRT